MIWDPDSKFIFTAVFIMLWVGIRGAFSACKQKKDKKSFLIKYCILKVGFAKSEIYSKLLKLVICSNPHSKCSISRRDSSGLNKHRFYKAVNSQTFI